MPAKQSKESEDRIDIFGRAFIKRRGKIWQIHMPVGSKSDPKRISLKTDDREAAVAKAKEMVLQVERTGMSPDLLFNLTVDKAIDSYLELRAEDIETGSGLDGITIGRWKTLRTQLSHWRKYLGGDTLISSLQRNSGKGYKQWRRNDGIALSTILNEQGTMNSVLKTLHDNDQIGFPKFKMTKIRVAEVSTRNNPRVEVFTPEEMQRIESYLAKIISSPEELVDRLCACYFLFQIGTAIRPTEALRLQWQDVRSDTFRIKKLDKDGGIELASDDDSAEEIILHGVDVPAEKAKTRLHRFVRFYDRYDAMTTLRLLQMKRNKGVGRSLKKQLIFHHKNNKALSGDAYRKFFRTMLTELDIARRGRLLQAKSFRHFFITSRIEAGHSISQIAEIAGTSEEQIRKTYYHLFDEHNVRSALHGVSVRGGVIL